MRLHTATTSLLCTIDGLDSSITQSAHADFIIIFITVRKHILLWMYCILQVTQLCFTRCTTLMYVYVVRNLTKPQSQALSANRWPLSLYVRKIMHSTQPEPCTHGQSQIENKNLFASVLVHMFSEMGYNCTFRVRFSMFGRIDSSVCAIWPSTSTTQTE